MDKQIQMVHDAPEHAYQVVDVRVFAITLLKGRQGRLVINEEDHVMLDDRFHDD